MKLIRILKRRIGHLLCGLGYHDYRGAIGYRLCIRCHCRVPQSDVVRIVEADPGRSAPVSPMTNKMLSADPLADWIEKGREGNGW